MDNGSPYIKSAIAYHKFLRKAKMTLTESWGSHAAEWRKQRMKPYSIQLFYMVRVGVRCIPGDLAMFFNERHGGEFSFEDMFQTLNLDEEPVKRNTTRIPRQRELFRNSGN